MSNNLIRLPGRTGFEKLSHPELCEKLRAAYEQLNAFDKQLQAVASAVFREGDSERPGDLDDLSGDEIIEGVKSLHELTDRLHGENDHLRAELLKARGHAELIAAAEEEAKRGL